MAVSKTFPPESIVEAHIAGQRLFGENKVQEFAEKADRLTGLRGAGVSRMIGHLQSNKAAKAVELFQAIDSLDSAKLTMRLNAAAATAGRSPSGAHRGSSTSAAKMPRAVLPRIRPELTEILNGASGPGPICKFGGARGRCLPCADDPEGARPYFLQAPQLRDQLAARNYSAVSRLDELSMGMSHDFEVAIEEGSTLRACQHGNFRRADEAIMETRRLRGSTPSGVTQYQRGFCHRALAPEVRLNPQRLKPPSSLTRKCTAKAVLHPVPLQCARFPDDPRPRHSFRRDLSGQSPSSRQKERHHWRNRRRTKTRPHLSSHRRSRQRSLHCVHCRIFECSALLSYHCRRRKQPP